MHHPEFQKLEGTWRGLDYLVKQSETGERLRIKVLNVSKKELAKDLEKAVEFDQSRLFKIVYEDEYGQLGGHPFGMLIGDYEFGKHPQDVEFLRKMAGVCSAAHAPFIAAAAPEHVRPGQLHRAEPAPRPGQDLPERRLRRLEELPGERGQPVRRPGAAAGAGPAAVRGRHQADRGVQLRRGRRRHRPREVPVDERRLGLRGPGAPTPSPRTAGSCGPAASKAAARSKTCRSTPSPRTAAGR